MPSVSAIISTYNSERFIQGRLDDLVQQTIFKDIEIIIVNSGSVQNERRIADSYRKRYSNIIYIETKERETIYKAWNRAIRIAKGTYITNANTDDRLRHDALELMVAVLEAHTSAAMVYGDQYLTCTPNSTYLENIRGKHLQRLPYTRLRLLGGYIFGSQPMWRKMLHSDMNIWFDEHYEVAGDYDFALRVAEHFSVYYLPVVLGTYYCASDNSNKEHQNAQQTGREADEIKEKYMRRYIASLNSHEYKLLYRTMRRWIALPQLLYSMIHHSLELLDKRKQINNKIFWCWLGSLWKRAAEI